MLGRIEHLVARPLLDDPPGVHDHDAVRDLRNDAQVMRDEDDRGRVLALEPLQQRQHLGLDRHVERGRRLIGDQDLGVVGERDRGHGPLPHPAGELVWVAECRLVGTRDAHVGE